MLSHLYRRFGSAVSPLASSSPILPEALEPRQLMSAATAVTYETYLDGVQVRVVGTDGDDQIEISQDPSLGLVIRNSADSSVVLYGGAYKTIRVEGGDGNDIVFIDPTVGVRTFLYGGDGDDFLVGGPNNDYLSGGGGDNVLYAMEGDDVLVTVGGGVADQLNGGAGRDSFWYDARRTEAVYDLTRDEVLAGGVHRVNTFFSRVRDPLARTELGNVSLAVKDLPDPAISDARFVYSNFADNPIFSDTGPRADEVVQGMIGDCYFMVVLSSVAALNPTKLRESVVDLGDGTYAVQFRRGSARAYVRVDADLPVYNGSQDPGGAGGVPAYADVGDQGALWAALMEKAFAVVRTPDAGYAGIDGGWMREAYSLLGSKSRSFWTNDGTILGRFIQLLLASGRSVTFGTYQPPGGVPLLSYHAYTVVGVTTDALGNVLSIQMRNPWGVDGAATGDGVDDGYLTVTVQQALSALSAVSTAYV